MGASLIERTVRARNIQEAWQKVYQDAEDYSGHQGGYSGDFNTCEFTKDVTPMLKKHSIRSLDEYITENASKREAWGYCIEPAISNKSKVKSQVEVIPQKGARKWETVYKAVTRYDGREVVRDKSQTACIKKARIYVEQNPDVDLRIIISKELTEGHVICANVSYKKSKTEKLGLYKFVAWAAE